MKCPEKEKLSLYVDGELEGSELAEVRSHLESCSVCAREVEEMAGDDAVLREGVTAVFASHRMSGRIMAEIRSNPAMAGSTPESSSWWQRLLVPALALTLVLIAALFLLPSSQKYHGSAAGISFQALNQDSTVDGIKVAPEQLFALQICEKKALAGSFLFTLPGEHPSEFVMKGTAVVSVSDQQPVFSDAAVNLDLVKGGGLQVIVNDYPVTLADGAVSYRSLEPVEKIYIDYQPVEAVATSSDAHAPVIMNPDPVPATATAEAAVLETPESAIEGIVTSPSVGLASETAPVVSGEPPASGVDHIGNPFTDQPLGPR